MHFFSGRTLNKLCCSPVLQEILFFPQLQFLFPIILKIIHVPSKILMQDVRREASRLLIHAYYYSSTQPLKFSFPYYELLSFNYSPLHCIFGWISFTFSPFFINNILFSQYSQANINKQICQSKNCITNKTRKV